MRRIHAPALRVDRRRGRTGRGDSDDDRRCDRNERHRSGYSGKSWNVRLTARVVAFEIVEKVIDDLAVVEADLRQLAPADLDDLVDVPGLVRRSGS